MTSTSHANTRPAGAAGRATQRLRERFAAALMPNYGLPPLALARGRGCWVQDADGQEYLDLIAGIAVSSLGHAHPAVIDAVTSQVASLAHTSNLFLHEREVELAERLLALIGSEGAAGAADSASPKTDGPKTDGRKTGGPKAVGKVFFTNSGTEANEAALKLVRRFHGPARSVVVAAEGGFHGRTMGALALTGKAQIREPFGPFGVTVRFVPYGDADALRGSVAEDCAAVFLEPTLGEGGVVPPPDGYLRAARDACDAAGALLVLDEIQSGIGRTGTWFAHQHEHIRPDVLTLAKGLGGGLPIGACIGLGEFGAVFSKGDHGSTFGGNPVACAAALAVLRVIESDGLLARATQTGERLRSGIQPGGSDTAVHPLITGVRGRGLWLAVVLGRPVAADVERACMRAGFLVNAVQPDAIRLAPPLILAPAEADSFLAALPRILDQVLESRAGAKAGQP